jgi:hypothetical protein
MKTGADALGIVENESGSAKHENGTRRPQYRPKQDLSPLSSSKMSSGAQK